MNTADVNRYRLLADAIAGTKVVVTTDTNLRAWTDGVTIYLPAADASAWRHSVVVQAALLAAGSLRPSLVVKMTGRRHIAARYLTLETARAMHLFADLIPRAIASRVTDVYDGELTGSPEESYRRAKSAYPVAEPPPWFGTIRPSKIIVCSAKSIGDTPTDKDVGKSRQNSPLPSFDDDEQMERSRILELLSRPSAKPLPGAIQKFFGARRAPTDQAGAGGQELRSSGGRVARGGEFGLAAKSTNIYQGLPGPHVGRTYPEWDWRTQSYRLDHCTVADFDPDIDPEPGELDDGQDPALRRALIRLGVAHARCRRQIDGDTLDVTALVEFAADRMMGGTNDGHVYELKRQTAHDLGVMVLLDVSGSTRDCEQGRSVFDDQRNLAARLIATFDELGDRVAGYGFQSWGRNSVKFLRVKRFDDRYDVQAQRRLAALKPGGFTRLGAAIRHGSYLVREKSGVHRTLLVIVGDGLPYEDGYEARYAEEDSRQALSEAVTAGVGCACVSVQTATDDRVLQRVWGHVPCVKLDSPADLAREAIPIFVRGLREAVALGRDGRSC